MSSSYVTSQLYDNDLKIQCAYDVVRAYSHILRPGVQWTDTKFIVLMTMCRMIDRSIELNDSAISSVAEPSDADDTFDLETLSADDREMIFDKVGSIARDGKLSTNDRMDLMESIVTMGTYF